MTRRDSWRSVALVVLLVGATLAGAAGTASAAGGGPYTHSFDTSKSTLLIDFGSHSGQVDIKLTSDEVPGSSDIIYAGTLSTNQMSNNKVYFVNGGAYNQVTATITGPSNRPTFSHEGDKIAREAYSLGGSGGDVDMKCGPLEEVRASTGSGAAAVDCTGYPGISSINTSETDAEQTKIDLYQDAANLEAGNDAYWSSSNNTLLTARSKARSEGIEAYVSAVNNGSGEIVAQEAAIDAVEENYAALQRNLNNRWQASIATQMNMIRTAKNETSISGSYASQIVLYQPGQTDLHDFHLQTDDGNSGGDTSQTLTLADGSTVESRILWARGDNVYDLTRKKSVAINRQSPWGHGKSVSWAAVQVQPYDSSVGPQTAFRPRKYAIRWNAIKEQNKQVEAEMRTLANRTYPEIQSGELDPNELLTPQASSTIGPESGNYSTYVYRLLSSVGVDSPENLENLGSMTVNVSDGGTYEGILLSRDTPANGFEVGQTYDPDRLNGSQYLLQGNQTRTLDSTFTLESATNTDGDSLDRVRYRDGSYRVTNVTELRELFNRSSYVRSQIEARQQDRVANSGIPGSDGGGPDTQQYLLLIAGGAVALIVVLNFANQR
ncbi:hypothetical protein [Haloarcula salinisoli]|uniref:Envelope protein N-terminal domain-containing protein n=1 Tax=Haloarcula salinisoli TaxID=2487746 RepID=A0A8J8CBQ7_9EURY|nr:hypothetical protein [Halomicroarcula salinisoli]MBX0304738.1 hypothetical protein [Halomicroarcula salinisoli]